MRDADPERYPPRGSPSGATPDPPLDPTTHPYRWTMLGGVWLVYFSFGLTAAALAPLVGTIVEELGISLAAMGSVLGAWPLVYIATAVPAGAFVDRFGLRRSLLACTAVIALSGLARGVAGSYVELFLAVAIFGVGGPLVSIGAPKLISLWFAGRERGLAMGIYITGPAIGGILALSLTNSLVLPALGGEWRRVLVAYGLVVVAVGVAWAAISAHPVSRAVERAAAAAGREPQLAVFARLARARVVQVTLLMSVGIFFFNHGLNNWLPEILRRGGMDAASAGHWAAVPTAVGILGSLTLPRLATPERRVRILLGLFLCAGAATLLLRADPGPVLGLGLVAQGIARSAMMPIAVLLLVEAREVGPRHAGAAGGLFFSAAEVGGVLGPLTIGLLADRTGGFSAALWMLGGICVGLSLLLLALPRGATGERGRSG